MLSRIAKCCTHGDGSSPMDQRWYRTFATLLLLLFLEAFVITSVYKLLLTGIALPLSISTAPNISESALPPAYAFWLTGNTSFFEVATTNQTDMNMSSPTYGYWLPPAEWRDYCIQSSGLPIHACSYFQYEEFPEVMTAFYVLMFAFELLIVIGWAVKFLEASKIVYSCCRKQSNSPGGLRALLTPWGFTHSKAFHQQDLTVIAYLALPPISIAIMSWYFVYATALVAPGFGLANSFGTGKLYFGALWNVFPLESKETFLAEHDANHPIFSQLGAGFYSTQVFYEPLMNFLAWYGYQMLFSSYICMVSSRYGKKDASKELAKDTMHNIVLPVDNLCSAKSWYVATVKYGFLRFVYVWMFYVVWPTMPAFAVVALFLQASPEYLANGDQGMLGWMQYSHLVAFTITFTWPLHVMVIKFATFRPLQMDLSAGKHLISAQAYVERIKKLKRTEWFYMRGWFGLLIYLLMPAGMAMQVYGPSVAPFWVSPLNLFFHKPDATFNLLGAPIFILTTKILTFTLFVMHRKLMVLKVKNSVDPK